jgi:hypothetical protein
MEDFIGPYYSLQVLDATGGQSTSDVQNRAHFWGFLWSWMHFSRKKFLLQGKAMEK